jgi:hypothetical protein
MEILYLIWKHTEHYTESALSYEKDTIMFHLRHSVPLSFGQ